MKEEREARFSQKGSEHLLLEVMGKAAQTLPMEFYEDLIRQQTFQGLAEALMRQQMLGYHHPKIRGPMLAATTRWGRLPLQPWSAEVEGEMETTGPELGILSYVSTTPVLDAQKKSLMEKGVFLWYIEPKEWEQVQEHDFLYVPHFREALGTNQTRMAAFWFRREACRMVRLRLSMAHYEAAERRQWQQWLEES